MSMKPIGILGGMGPGAGVYFKRLIVDLTPATCDQEHIPIVLYTNPHIPDRTTAILRGTREDFVGEVCTSLQKLEQFGVSEIFIPCNTSFVGFDQYERAVDTPIYHMPERTLDVLQERGVAATLLFATSGTYATAVYSSRAGLEVRTPDRAGQTAVHELITAVKSGDVSTQQRKFTQVIGLIPDDVESVILGCTELSMLAGQFRVACPSVQFVDPLEVAAQYIVERYAVGLAVTH